MPFMPRRCINNATAETLLTSTQNTFNMPDSLGFFKFTLVLMQCDYTSLSLHESNHKEGQDSCSDDGGCASRCLFFATLSSFSRLIPPD